MAEYYYLVCSLPDLNWETESPLRLDRFLGLCSDWLSEAEKNTLQMLSLRPPEPRDNSDYFAEKPELKLLKTPILSSWYRWETALRNRLVQQRARTGQDVSKMLHGEPEFFIEIETGVTEAWTQTDPKERERVLDRLRWRFFEQLENEHAFDFGYLCLYKLKLMLKEKWQPRQRDAGRAVLEQTLVAVEHNRAQESATVAAE